MDIGSHVICCCLTLPCYTLAPLWTFIYHHLPTTRYFGSAVWFPYDMGCGKGHAGPRVTFDKTCDGTPMLFCFEYSCSLNCQTGHTFACNGNMAKHFWQAWAWTGTGICLRHGMAFLTCDRHFYFCAFVVNSNVLICICLILCGVATHLSRDVSPRFLCSRVFPPVIGMHKTSLTANSILKDKRKTNIFEQSILFNLNNSLFILLSLHAGTGIRQWVWNCFPVFVLDFLHGRCMVIQVSFCKMAWALGGRLGRGKGTTFCSVPFLLYSPLLQTISFCSSSS